MESMWLEIFESADGEELEMSARPPLLKPNGNQDAGYKDEND